VRAHAESRLSGMKHTSGSLCMHRVSFSVMWVSFASDA
jgi:hypothetical protein